MTVTIFLVDDHAVVRDGLRLLLETQPDFRVIGEAGSGLQALARLKEQCPDVVIMDIMLPQLNGIETTRQLLDICSATRVIILSMHSSADHISHALQAGAQGYVLKSSVGTEVVAAIRAILEGHRYLSQKVSDRVIDDYLARLNASEPLSPLSDLSQRELSILQLVAEGHSSAEIAQLLVISPNTVDTYRSRLMQKLDLHSVSDLVKFAIRQGLISLD